MRKSNLSPNDISQHQAPTRSSVQDYLARKYAALGIDPPEPNGHQPGHIPANLNDERSDVAPKPSAGDQPIDPAYSEGERRSDLADSFPEAESAKPEATAAPKPLTRDQRTALDLLERGKTVTDIMDTLGFNRKTFYDWRDASPTFAAAVQRTRDERRGVLVDAVEDIQLAGLTLIDNYIRSDHASDSIRLRAVGLIFRYGNTENILPRRLVASLTGPDGLTPIDPKPQAGPTVPAPSEQRSDVANSSPEAGSQEPQPESAPPPAESSNQEPVSPSDIPTSHTEETVESVRSVRFENPESITASPSEPETNTAPSEIRTPNVSDGFPPSPERERRDTVPPAPAPTAEGAIPDNGTPSDGRSHIAPNPCGQSSDPANSTPDAAIRNPEVAAANSSADPGPAPPAPPPKPRKPETILTDAFLAATFLYKHEPRPAFERLLKHQLRAYAPATPQEELLTFRITQKSWILRRLDTFERIIADSAVTKVRAKHPNAAPAACIAMTFLERKDTETTRFYERIAQQRKAHEAALDRLETKLQSLQHRRQARQDRRESREDRHTKPAQRIPLPATPKALQRAAA